ncbi:MAG TPA: hydroxyisourate hydrolase [Casimicrobiaceae bacterium]|jgi:5-hydroxyisourate hydrolase
MPGLSIHVVDVTTGTPAHGMRVEVYAIGVSRTVLGDAVVGVSGGVELPQLASHRCAAGIYECLFHAGAWYRERGVALPTPPFLELVPFRFGIADPEQHYHLPLKLSPWGFSLFRGGA